MRIIQQHCSANTAVLFPPNKDEKSGEENSCTSCFNLFVGFLSKSLTSSNCICIFAFSLCRCDENVRKVSMLHKVISRRRESSPSQNLDGTPVMSVLESLNVSNNQDFLVTNKSNMERGSRSNRKPLRIEDVPFR